VNLELADLNPVMSRFDADLAGLPSWVEEVIEQVLPAYEEEIEKHNPWLEAQGRQMTRLAFKRMFPSVSTVPSKGADEPQPRDVVAGLYEPVLEPLERGAMDEAGLLAKPILIGGIVLFLGCVTGAFFLGRASRRP